MRRALVLLLCGCSGVTNPFICDETNPCDAGAGGGSGTAGGSATGGGTAGGANGGGTGGGSAGGAGGGTTMSDGGVCMENWQCGPWTTDGGPGNRTCLDINGTGTTQCKPIETGPLPALDYNYFRCRVQPILAQSCAMIGCHGSEPARPFKVFARGRLRNHEMLTEAWPGCLINTPQTFDLYDRAAFTVQCWGNRCLTAREWRSNYDNARVLALGTTAPAQSELLTQPLSSSGFSHAGMKFWATGSPMYATISTWLDGGSLATCDAGFNDHN